ncbi:hypothetical protein [Roseibium sp. M-1]
MFSLIAMENKENAFLTENLAGTRRLAVRIPSLDSAQTILQTNIYEIPITYLLLPTNEISDSHSFRMFNVGIKGSGEQYLSEENFLISCNSFPGRHNNN